MILSDEVLAKAEIRKQCGIPIEETPTHTVICPEEAVGEIGITLDNGMTFDMPICQGHYREILKDYSLKLDNN